MTLIEVINLCREDLADESIGVRRSWEDMFRYTLKHYPERTALAQFDANDFEKLLLASGVNRPIVDGYVMRWRDVSSDMEAELPNNHKAIPIPRVINQAH